MDKYAADKIAEEYYNLGLRIALGNVGHTKVANQKHKLLEKLLGGTANVGSTFGSGLLGYGLGSRAGHEMQPLIDYISQKPLPDGFGELIGGLAGVASGVKLAPTIKTPELKMIAPSLLDTVKLLAQGRPPYSGVKYRLT